MALFAEEGMLLCSLRVTRLRLVFFLWIGGGCLYYHSSCNFRIVSSCMVRCGLLRRLSAGVGGHIEGRWAHACIPDTDRRCSFHSASSRADGGYVVHPEDGCVCRDGLVPWWISSKPKDWPRVNEDSDSWRRFRNLVPMLLGANVYWWLVR